MRRHSSRMSRPGLPNRASPIGDERSVPGPKAASDKSGLPIIGLPNRAAVCRLGRTLSIPRPLSAKVADKSTAKNNLLDRDCLKGLTLFEVVLSLTIFLGSAAVLSQLISTGVRAAVQSRLKTQAILRCESKMSEIIAGAELLQDVSDATFEGEDDDGWRWSLQVLPGPEEYLLELVVTVSHLGDSQNALSTTTFTLRRYLRDPQVYLDAAESAAESDTTEETR